MARSAASRASVATLARRVAIYPQYLRYLRLTRKVRNLENAAQLETSKTNNFDLSVGQDAINEVLSLDHCGFRLLGEANDTKETRDHPPLA